MKSIYLPILAFTATLAHTSAVPTLDNDPLEFQNGTLVRRDKGDDESDPLDLDIDCTGVETVCDADCMAILCFGAPRVIQHKQSERKRHYTESGASLVPFDGSKEDLESRKVSRPNDLCISAEETTFESADQGGWGCIVVPVQRKQNTDHGSHVSAAYTKSGVSDGKWGKQNFNNVGDKAPYCKALMSNPPDKSICDQKKDDAGDIINYAYRKLREKQGRSFVFQRLIYGQDTWKGFFSRKRDVGAEGEGEGKRLPEGVKAKEERRAEIEARDEHE